MHIPNGLFDDQNPNSYLTVYLRYTHLDLSVFSKIVKGIYKIHQAITAVVNNAFMISDVYKDGLRNVLHVDCVSATTNNSMEIKIREGWTPAFQPPSDDFLVDSSKVLGMPALITSQVISTMEKTVLANSNFLEGPKKRLMLEIEENKDCKAIFDAVQENSFSHYVSDLILSWIQTIKSIDAIRSVSINGVNILSFDVNRRKYKRYFVDFPASLSIDGDTISAFILNISRGGCVFKLDRFIDIKSASNTDIRFSEYKVKPSDITVWRNSDQSFARAIFDPPIEDMLLKKIMGC
jgi:hypothetical protein